MGKPYAKTDVGMLTKNAQNIGVNRLARKLTQSRVKQLAEDGEMPLDVMIENMLFWRNKAQELESMLVDRLAVLQPIDAVNGEAERTEAQVQLQRAVEQIKDIGEHFLAARDKAQACAVECAPYVHARIAPVHLKSGGDSAAKLIQAQASPQDAMAAYLESLRVVEIQAEGQDAGAADLGEAADAVAS